MRWRRSIDHLGEPLVSREELGQSPLWPTAAILTAALGALSSNQQGMAAGGILAALNGAGQIGRAHV